MSLKLCVPSSDWRLCVLPGLRFENRCRRILIPRQNRRWMWGEMNKSAICFPSRCAISHVVSSMKSKLEQGNEFQEEFDELNPQFKM